MRAACREDLPLLSSCFGTFAWPEDCCLAGCSASASWLGLGSLRLDEGPTMNGHEWMQRMPLAGDAGSCEGWRPWCHG